MFRLTAPFGKKSAGLPRRGKSVARDTPSFASAKKLEKVVSRLGLFPNLEDLPEIGIRVRLVISELGIRHRLMRMRDVPSVNVTAMVAFFSLS